MVLHVRGVLALQKIAKHLILQHYIINYLSKNLPLDSDSVFIGQVH